MFIGRSEERRLRPGSQNVVGIMGLAHACQLASWRLGTQQGRRRDLGEPLWQALSEQVREMTRHTPMEKGLANTLGVSPPGVLGQDMLSLSPGPAASTGPAGHAGDENPAESLLMMGVTNGAARGAVALSLGHGSPEVGITAAADQFVFALRVTLGQ